MDEKMRGMKLLLVNLREADLRGANLYKARNLTAKQVEFAKNRLEVRLPDDLPEPPAPSS